MQAKHRALNDAVVIALKTNVKTTRNRKCRWYSGRTFSMEVPSPRLNTHCSCWSQLVCGQDLLSKHVGGDIYTEGDWCRERIRVILTIQQLIRCFKYLKYTETYNTLNMHLSHNICFYLFDTRSISELSLSNLYTNLIWTCSELVLLIYMKPIRKVIDIKEQINTMCK